ncbi:cytochrome c [Myxococcota bacterium]|nr:cytochrome c [Myxococcota bacterium]
MTRARGTVVCTLSLTVALAACASPRKSAPFVGDLTLTSDAQRTGQRVFFTECNQCHPRGRAGLGPGLFVPDALIRAQVRAGLGAMPAFGEEQITDAELDALVAYVGLLKSAAP